MTFKELETKEVFNNSYGNSVYIDRYIYYEGTEQISIYIKSGYGASEKIINETYFVKCCIKCTNPAIFHHRKINYQT